MHWRETRVRKDGGRRGPRQQVRSLTIRRNELSAAGRQMGFLDAFWKEVETEQFNRENKTCWTGRD